MTFVVVTILLGFAWLLSLSCAQLSATLHPQEAQNVCPGQTIAYNCVGNGSKMELFSPPIVEESEALTLFWNDSVQPCNVRRGSAAAIILSDSPESLSFMGTLVLYISSEHPPTTYDVYCRVYTTEGNSTMTSSSFTVMNKLKISELNDSSLDIADEVISYSADTAQVNVTWNLLDGAELFSVQIEETNQTFHIVESYFIVTLPYGTYFANLVAKGHCDSYHQNFSIMVEATSAPHKADVASIVLGVISGIFSIILCCCSCCCILYCLKQRKNSMEERYDMLDFAQPYHTDVERYEPDSPMFSDGYMLGSTRSSLSPLYQGPVGVLSMPRKVCVYTANSRAKEGIDSADKIVLSQHVLMYCVQQDFSLPTSFKLEHPDTGKFVYAGVYDYSSPSPEMASLPRWMMEHLGASEGEEMTFDHVDLPQGTFVKLQPVSSAWLGIPYDTRTEMMESQLRKFQTLTEGTMITLTYELNRYTLRVLECKPSKGILIKDVDIATDIVEPADFASGNHSIVEGHLVKLGLDEPFKCQVDANSYKYFMLLPGEQLPPCLRVEVKCTRGDPDMFLSQSCYTPSQSRYTWCNQDVGYSEISLSSDDKDYNVEKPLFAGVVSLCEDTEFTITVHRNDTIAASRGRHFSSGSGKSLREIDNQQSSLTSTAPAPFSLATPTSSPAENERCYSCHRVMPSHLLAMHERHCAQQTYRCPTCNKCVPKSAERKHQLIAHELLVCECGQKLSQFELHHHQLTECIKRSAKCRFKFCNLYFPMDELTTHEKLCRTKYVSCPVCNEEVMQEEAEGHLEAFHTKSDNNLIAL